MALLLYNVILNYNDVRMLNKHVDNQQIKDEEALYQNLKNLS